VKEQLSKFYLSKRRKRADVPEVLCFGEMITAL